MEQYCNTYVTEKCVISGDIVEFYKYSIPIRCDYVRSHSIFKIKPDSNEGYERRIDNLARARQNVRRIIWANLTPHTKFLTLTVKDNITEVKAFKRMFTTFLQAMKRKGYDLEYLYVLERQKRGAIHAHCVVFNNEKIPLKVLKECWHYGRSEIKILNGLKYKDKEKIVDVGAYVCKYITKESVTEWGSRTYNCSLGLKRSKDISLKSYGDFKIGIFESPYDTSRIFVEQLLHQCSWSYCDTKSICLDRSEAPILQNIDYFQGNMKGELYFEFK